LLPNLAKVAVCSQEQGRQLLEIVLDHVETKNEMAISFLRRFMENAGINASSQEKVYQVRKWLETLLITKVKNYFHDPECGYRHGNFYMCGLAVSFAQEVEAAQVFAATPLPPVGRVQELVPIPPF